MRATRTMCRHFRRAAESRDDPLVGGTPATGVLIRIAAPPNKGMKLTKLSAAPFRGRSAGSCPRRPVDAGTASQLISGVRRTSSGHSGLSR